MLIFMYLSNYLIVSCYRGFAKKTLLKTARKAGLKPKPSKRQKYVLPSADARSLTSPPLMSSLSADTLSRKYISTYAAFHEIAGYLALRGHLTFLITPRNHFSGN